jgi:putative cardiolipin synthase
LLDQLGEVTASLRIVSPYLVPTRPLYQGVRRLLRRGVGVLMLSNSLAGTDMPLAYSGYRTRRKRLLNAGVRLFELRPGNQRCLHAKLALFDDSHLLVGSLNLDPRSSYLNTEIALLLHGQSLAAEVQSWLDLILTDDSAWPLCLSQGQVRWPQSNVEPQTSRWQRFWVTLVSYLPLRGLL